MRSKLLFKAGLYPGLSRALSSRTLKISCEEDSTSSLGNISQYSLRPRVKILPWCSLQPDNFPPKQLMLIASSLVNQYPCDDSTSIFSVTTLLGIGKLQLDPPWATFPLDWKNPILLTFLHTPSPLILWSPGWRYPFAGPLPLFQSLLNWGHQNWTQCTRCGLTRAK